MLLKQGDLAPYSGVLSPETRFRFYQTQFDDKESCVKKLDEVSLSLPEPPFLMSEGQIRACIFGVMLGLIGGLLINR